MIPNPFEVSQFEKPRSVGITNKSNFAARLMSLNQIVIDTGEYDPANSKLFAEGILVFCNRLFVVKLELIILSFSFFYGNISKIFHELTSLKATTVNPLENHNTCFIVIPTVL